MSEWKPVELPDLMRWPRAEAASLDIEVRGAGASNYHPPMPFWVIPGHRIVIEIDQDGQFRAWREIAEK